MNIKNALLAATFVGFSINGCSQTSPVETQTSINEVQILETVGVKSVLMTDISELWRQDFNHYQESLLLEVSLAISVLAKQNNVTNKDLEKLSFYLRVYSSFGPDKEWAEGTAQALNTALFDLQNIKGFYQLSPATAQLHENYAVALYRLYFLEEMRLKSALHIKPLTKLINLYATSELDADTERNSLEYALWEIIRASAILPYEATRKNKSEHLAIYGENNTIPDSLLNFINSPNATIKGDNWPKQHAVWALAQYYNVYSKQYWNAYYEKSEAEQKLLDDDKLTLPQQKQMTQLDNDTWLALEKSMKHVNGEVNNNALKTLFSVPYVVSTFRGKTACENGSLKDRCIQPTIEEATPIKHICSDSLFIRTQKMTQDQLESTCQQLISQENIFHEKLATNRVPAANDFNDKLRVVVFSNAAEYNKYGQLTFDIGTNNGGMYIEGTTQDPDNQATFYSYEHFWVRPKFQVWNLHHEYVHYLDGRFLKYDTFNHFPSHLVWWSEGLAEYISKGDNNPKAFKLLNKTEQKQWLTLQQVFDTKYRDGNDQVYQWGYLAVRFMFENHKEEYRQLAHFLKTDFFDGYKGLLDKSGSEYQEEFVAWLTQHNENFTAIDEKSNPHKPRQFYRYSYKDYLQPAHLIESDRHMHWQYWHENALKQN